MSGNLKHFPKTPWKQEIEKQQFIHRTAEGVRHQAVQQTAKLILQLDKAAVQPAEKSMPVAPVHTQMYLIAGKVKFTFLTPAFPYSLVKALCQLGIREGKYRHQL